MAIELEKLKLSFKVKFTNLIFNLSKNLLAFKMDDGKAINLIAFKG